MENSKNNPYIGKIDHSGAIKVEVVKGSKHNGKAVKGNRDGNDKRK